MLRYRRTYISILLRAQKYLCFFVKWLLKLSYLNENSNYSMAFCEILEYKISSTFLVLTLSRLEFNVELRLSGMKSLRTLKFSNVSANILVPIFREIMLVWCFVGNLHRAGSGPCMACDGSDFLPCYHSPPTPCPIQPPTKSPTNILTLKMAAAMFAETVGNFQHSTQLFPEGRS